MKVFLSILYQYRWYFPADFDSSPFLSGRRFTFTGLYRSVFYVHIVAGPIAEEGFFVQSMLTGVTAVAAGVMARSGNLIAHRRWASRCYLLLWSPLFLRMIAGLTIVFSVESEWTYRINAWFSWLVPLACYEVHQWRLRLRWSGTPRLSLSL